MSPLSELILQREGEEVIEQSAPLAFRERLQAILLASGLSAQCELAEATGLAATSIRRILNAPVESSYLPNLSTAILATVRLARRNKPKPGKGLASWAERTFEEIEALCELHDQAKPESARRCPTTEHPAIPPSRSDQEAELPDWITLARAT